MTYKLVNPKIKYYTLHSHPDNFFCCGQSIKTIERLYHKNLKNNFDPSNGKKFFKELLIQFTREEIIAAANGDPIESKKFIEKMSNTKHFPYNIFFPINMNIVISIL